MKKMEFREISRNFTELYHTKFSGIQRNFSQFRAEYGIDGSKKTDGIMCRRNSADTLLWGHPPPHILMGLRETKSAQTQTLPPLRLYLLLVLLVV